MSEKVKFDWAGVTKQELKGVDDQGNYIPVPPGGYDAMLTNIQQVRTKNGAFGIEMTYSITSGEFEDRKVKETLYLLKKDGSANVHAQAKMKTRMMQTGLTSDQINNFKGPESEKGLGDFKHMLDAKVRIEVTHEEVKEGPAAGKKFPRVTKVSRR